MASEEEKQIPYVIEEPAKPIRVTLIPHENYSCYNTTQIVVSSCRNRTVFQNLGEVEKYMRIPALYLIIYFGFKLGVHVQYDTSGIKQPSLSGLHDSNTLSKICQGFVKEVLSCPRCKLPEITMRIEYDGRSKEVKGKCAACGHKGRMLEHNPTFASFVTGNTNWSNFNRNKTKVVPCSSSSKSNEEEPSFEEELEKVFKANWQPSTTVKLVEQTMKEYGKSSLKTSQIIFQIIFGTEHNHQAFLTSLKAHQQTLQLFLRSDSHRLNSFLEVLMQRLESLPSTQQKIILKMLYEEEILEEHQVIGWFDGCKKSLQENFPSVVESIVCFVEWLKQPAESDEE